MLELGIYSKQEHTAILELLKNYPEAKVYTVGKNFHEIARSFNCQPFPNVEELCTFLHKTPVTKGDVLIKGSRGIQLEKVLTCF
jgi:UDP-N-acetylmuramoyl-tripeptide--D-alanyl-D-alanine ligase